MAIWHSRSTTAIERRQIGSAAKHDLQIEERTT